MAFFVKLAIKLQPVESTSRNFIVQKRFDEIKQNISLIPCLKEADDKVANAWLL